MATSGLDQFFDKMRTNEEFLTFFQSEIQKYNCEQSEEPMETIESPFLYSFDGGVQLPDDVYTPDYQSLPSPIFEQMDFSDLEQPLEEWPDTNEIQYLGTFQNNNDQEMVILFNNV